MRRQTAVVIALFALQCMHGCTALDQSPDADAARESPFAARPVITVAATEAGRPLDPRLFGTNVPAWVNPASLANDMCAP